MAQIKAVLFDLDDTLYDHRFSSRKGLETLKNNFNCFKDIQVVELEKEHLNLLNEIHLSKVLAGLCTIDEARAERYKRLFSKYGVNADTEIIESARTLYSTAYRTNQRAVPGAIELLQRLKTKFKIAIVSNNYGVEQKSKIDVCGFAIYLDAIVTSVEVGFTKPSPEIFLLALDKLGCLPNEAVMIGDSWDMDITGAKNAGIRAIWFNRYGNECPEPSSSVEVDSLIPAEKIINLIT
jgi:putative hydrolase of the HAD superfamily